MNSTIHASVNFIFFELIPYLGVVSQICISDPPRKHQQTTRWRSYSRLWYRHYFIIKKTVIEQEGLLTREFSCFNLVYSLSCEKLLTRCCVYLYFSPGGVCLGAAPIVLTHCLAVTIFANCTFNNKIEYLCTIIFFTAWIF